MVTWEPHKFQWCGNVIPLQTVAYWTRLDIIMYIWEGSHCSSHNGCPPKCIVLCVIQSCKPRIKNTIPHLTSSPVDFMHACLLFMLPWAPNNMHSYVRLVCHYLCSLWFAMNFESVHIPHPIRHKFLNQYNQSINVWTEKSENCLEFSFKQKCTMYVACN